MKYYLIAGEASGDMHGANLMRAIKEKDAAAEFRFWGGDKMKEIGGEQVEHYKNTAFMGFLEVVANLRTILGFIKKCKADITSWQPDKVILIDYPGFNLRIAEFAKSAGCKVIYYISPQVWAWKENRVKKIKKHVDRMLVILPFEKDFYKKWNYEVDFVGHPLLDEIGEIKTDSKESKVRQIALLPGSRHQEIAKILPEFAKMVPLFPGYHFVIAGLGHISPNFYETFTNNTAIEVLYNQTYSILQQSEAALVASGTATLETALFNVPMVVGYKGSWLSYHIGRWLVKIKYIALVNLVMDKPVVKELIQNELNEQLLKKELELILHSDKRKQMLEDYETLAELLGKEGASERAAAIVVAT